MFKYKKLTSSILIALVGLLFFGIVAFGEKGDVKSKVDTSFAVFYGRVTAENIDTIAKYDIAILEPNGSNDTYNAILKNRNTLLFGYMSILEIEHFDAFKMSQMTDKMYLHYNREKVYLNKQKNYLGDIRNAAYRRLLIDYIGKKIVNNHYDGVFLDTVGFTEYFENADFNESLQSGYIEFLKELKAAYPNIKLFQNRGFKSFLGGAAKYVDYLLYEDFKYKDFIDKEYYQNLLNNLIFSAENNNVVICALSQEDKLLNKFFSDLVGWSFYYSESESNYLEISKQNNINSISIQKILYYPIEAYFSFRW